MYKNNIPVYSDSCQCNFCKAFAFMLKLERESWEGVPHTIEILDEAALDCMEARAQM